MTGKMSGNAGVVSLWQTDREPGTHPNLISYSSYCVLQETGVNGV
jgi:hypothetical protein